MFALSGPYTASDPGFVTEWGTPTAASAEGHATAVRCDPRERTVARSHVRGSRGHLGQGGVVAVGAPEKNLLENSNIPGFSFQPGHFSDDGQWLHAGQHGEVRRRLGAFGRRHLHNELGRRLHDPADGEQTAWRRLSSEGKTLAVAHGGKIEFYRHRDDPKSLGSFRVPAGEWEHAPLRVHPRPPVHARRHEIDYRPRGHDGTGCGPFRPRPAEIGPSGGHHANCTGGSGAAPCAWWQLYRVVRRTRPRRPTATATRSHPALWLLAPGHAFRNRAPITGFGIEKDGTVVTVGPGADVLHTGTPRTTRAMNRSGSPLKGTETSNNYPQVSPDGKFVAACSNEKVFVWEAPTDPKAQPKEVAAFEIARTRLFRFAPDGTKLVVTTERDEVCTVHMCDIKTGKRTDLECTPEYIEGVSFSGDGKRIGVVADNDFYFLDAVTGKQLAKYRTKGRMSSEFALNDTGDVLACSVSYSGPRSEFRFTDPLTDKKLDGLTGPDGSVYWLTFAADGKTLLIGDRYRIRWWDPIAAKLIRTFDGIAYDSFGLQRTPARFSPDGKTLVAHNGAALLRWDAATGKLLFPEQGLGHGAEVNGVGVAPNGKRIATRGMDNRVCVWDAATGKELAQAHAAWTNSPTIDFSPDGKFLYVGGPEWGEVTKLDAATGKAVTRFTTDPKGPKQASVYCTRLSKDGKTVFGLTSPYTSNDPGFVTSWDASTGERTKAIELPARAHIAGELSPGAGIRGRLRTGLRWDLRGRRGEEELAGGNQAPRVRPLRSLLGRRQVVRSDSVGTGWGRRGQLLGRRHLHFELGRGLYHPDGERRPGRAFTRRPNARRGGRRGGRVLRHRDDPIPGHHPRPRGRVGGRALRVHPPSGSRPTVRNSSPVTRTRRRLVWAVPPRPTK